MNARLLVIEDDADFAAMLREALAAKGFPATFVDTAETGLQLLPVQPFDLVLTDVNLPGMSGLEAISRIKALSPGTDVIVMTGYATRETALDAVKRGATDYFSKPFSLTELEVVIKRSLERRSLRSEVSNLRQALSKATGIEGLVGDSQPMRELKSMIAKVAGLDTTVLILGESGTGKEVVADAIHALSPRNAAPFIKLNCAAIPENLLESELFGFEKGAFTGAVTTKKGKFELANKGSLLLDELGDMPLSLQPKILRAVEYRQVERLGASTGMPVDVRLIAATHQDLPKLVEAKAFRADLYYRLSVAALRIPPLRERKEDIPQLVGHFIERINSRLGTLCTGASGGALEVLAESDWPGNVRQLANVIERGIIASGSDELTADVMRQAMDQNPSRPCTPLLAAGGEAAASGAAADGREERGPLRVRFPINLKEHLLATEADLLQEALRQSHGVQTEAAKLLGISAKNLWNKLQKHHFEVGGDG